MKAVKMSADFFGNYRDTIYAASLREDLAEQKVYVLYPNKEEEEVLYSFNSKAGDTVMVVSDYSANGFTDKIIRFVSSVETYTEGGISGKKINLTDIHYYDLYDRLTKDTAHIKSVINESSWLEGIGTIHGPIDPSELSFPQRYNVKSRIKNCGKASYDYLTLEYTLICFWNDTELLYRNPDYTECVYVTSDLDKPSGEEISIYPSPTKGVVNVKVSSGIELIELFDAQGKRILSTSKETVDLTALPNGLYFVKIRTSSDITKVQKIVKY